jgi:uncharacterized protein YgiM (DUF1202 family)
MKRYWTMACAVALSALWLDTATAAAPSTMSVQVKAGQMRAQPNFLGKVNGTLAYGDQVTILGTQGDWMQVQAKSGQTGWMHTSSLSKKKIVVKAGANDVGTTASGEELALAGKGFNSDVEADFKAKNKEIDFTWIDRMEKIRIPPAEIAAFLNEGGVKPAGGAR